MTDISLAHYTWYAISRLRSELSKLLNSNFGQVVISKNGKPVAVLMTIPEYNALQTLASQAANAPRLEDLVDDDDYRRIRSGDVDEFTTVVE